MRLVMHDAKMFHGETRHGLDLFETRRQDGRQAESFQTLGWARSLLKRLKHERDCDQQRPCPLPVSGRRHDHALAAGSSACDGHFGGSAVVGLVPSGITAAVVTGASYCDGKVDKNSATSL